MTDEPGGWELKRALSDLRTDVRDGNKAIRDEIAKLVTSDAHASDVLRLEDRIKGLADDLAAERQARVEAVALERETRTIEHNHEVTARKEAQATFQAQMDRTATWVRWVAASVLVPVVLFIANLLNARSA